MSSDEDPLASAPATNYLRWVGHGNYLMAGLAVLLSLLPGYLLVLWGLSGPSPYLETHNPLLGSLVPLVLALTLVACWAYAAGMAYAASCIDQRKGHNFCVAMAVVTLLVFPVGTFLGILSLVELNRKPAQEMFFR